MAAQIFQALAQGFTSRTILNQLGKQYPKFAGPINLALASGFTPQSILKKISMPKESASDANAFYTEHEMTLKRDEQDKRKKLAALAGTLGTAGAIGAGVYGALSARQAAQQAAQQPQNILPGAGGGQPPGPPPGGGGGGGGIPAFVGPAGGAPVNPAAQAQGVPGQPAPGQPTTPANWQQAMSQTPPVGGATAAGAGTSANPRQSLMKKAEMLPTATEQAFPQMGKFIQSMEDSGKSPEEIYDALKSSKMFSPVVHKVEKESGMSLLDMMKERKEGQLAGQPAPIAMGQKVMTSEGLIGDVHDTKKGASLIDVNGTKVQVKNDDTEPMPAEWNNIHVDLSQVPEDQRSSNINFVAATPDRKSIVMQFWPAKGKSPILYTYQRKDGQPFDEDLLNSINTETDAPVTSGMEFTGVWTPSGKSRGSAFHHKLKIAAQAIEDDDDPNKAIVFTRAPMHYQHGFMKVYYDKIQHNREMFNAYYKKPKKRK